MAVTVWGWRARFMSKIDVMLDALSDSVAPTSVPRLLSNRFRLLVWLISVVSNVFVKVCVITPACAVLASAIVAVSAKRRFKGLLLSTAKNLRSFGSRFVLPKNDLLVPCQTQASA